MAKQKEKTKEEPVYWQLNKIIDMGRIEGFMLELLCLAVMVKRQGEIFEAIEEFEGKREDRANRLNFKGFLSEFLGTALESRIKELDDYLCDTGAEEEGEQKDELGEEERQRRIQNLKVMEELVKEGKEKLGIE